MSEGLEFSYGHSYDAIALHMLLVLLNHLDLV